MDRKFSSEILSWIFIALVGIFFTSCKKEDVVEPEVLVAISIELVSGGDQTAIVETSLALPVVVMIKDQNGDAFEGASVTFAPSDGSVSSAKATTNAEGNAETTWILGATVGGQTLTVSLGDESITIDATGEAVPLVATSIELVSGGDQAAIIETALAFPVVVMIKDQNGDAFEGASLAFTTSDGSVSPATAITNAEGNAETTWILGATVGGQTLTASLGEESITIDATGEPIPLVATSIELVSGGDQAAFVENALALPIVVIVKDQNGDVFEGANVVFTTTEGAVSSATATTDVNGNAEIAWTLGATVGEQSLTVTGIKADGNTPLDGSPISVTASGVALAIGDFYEGGIIFYLDGNGGGLVCAVNDQIDGTRTEWGCRGTLINGADGTTIGTGAQNTTDIEAGCSTTGTAADICANLDLNGYIDWYLPSRDELNEMYTNRIALNAAAVNNGGNEFIFYYWSSSESSTNYAWRRNFDDGTQNGCAKQLPNRVRAVRAF